MPLVIDHLKDKDRTCPLFYCDVCGKLIESADEGNAVWDSEPGMRVVPTILHKDCDLHHLVGSKPSNWMDLTHFLFYLLHNLKMDEPKKLEDARRQVELLSRLTG